MPINAHPEFFVAEKKFNDCQTDAERVLALEEMIRKAPHHKGSENLLAQLRLKLKKLKEKVEVSKKKGKGGKEGIKKEDMQVVLVGLTNSGKSSLLKKLTNAQPKVSEPQYTTFQPEIGTMFYGKVPIQIIDQPSIGNENFDVGIVNTADTLLIVIEKFEDINEIKKSLEKARGKQIVVYNKSDKLNEKEKRKLSDKLRSKRYNAIIISTKTNENIDELKEKIFETFKIVRIYLKEPGKEPTTKPLIMKPGSNVKEVAEKIKKGLSNKVKDTRITGPSSKFPNQKVGLAHIVKDKDIVEFKTI